MPLKPLSPEHNFQRRVARRYGLDFVITGETLEEDDEYGTHTVREATGPEMQMWRKIVPEHIQAKLNRVWHEAQTLEATPQELHAVLRTAPFVYLCALDFAALRGNPPKDQDWSINVDSASVQHGRMAQTRDTMVFVSREIPTGYYLALPAPDPRLNWTPPAGERQIRPELDNFDFELRPL